MLRRIRRIAAVVALLLITLLFLDFTGTIHLWFGWLAKVQLVPAVLAFNVVVLVGLAVLTLLFGRLYCSVICPLGVMQDGVSHLSGNRKGKKNRFRYSHAKTWLRWSVLALFIIAVAVPTLSLIVSLLDPYAAYGRIAGGLLAPLYRLGNNLLAWGAEAVDSYAFYPTEVWVKNWITVGVAVVTLGLIGFLAWRGGRTYCNTICPVGTVLGFLSRFSIFRPTFQPDKCTKCGLCERRCKASCIDSKSMTIDQSRCVTCLNCVEACNFGAMKYQPRRLNAKKTSDEAAIQSKADSTDSDTDRGISRRSFLAIAGGIALTSTVKAQKLHVDGGLAEIEDKKIPDRKTPIVPPGAISLRNMKTHCTACQLCVSACPNQVLRPSSKLATLMQPEMSFERGYCRPECVECSAVCPAGAIRKIDTAEKSAISIGRAVWIKDNCIVNRDEVQCHNCEQHCPTGAITLVARDPGYGDSLKTPVVDSTLCIGCGACENLCPARPFSAIYVEGNLRHHAV